MLGSFLRSFTFGHVRQLDAAAHARPVGEAAGHQIGRPLAHPTDKIEYAQLLKDQGLTLGKIADKTGIPKTSLRRYLRTDSDKRRARRED